VRAKSQVRATHRPDAFRRLEQLPEPPGRSLMSVRGDAAPRGMTAHDRIRLIGPFAEYMLRASSKALGERSAPVGEPNRGWPFLRVAAIVGRSLQPKRSRRADRGRTKNAALAEKNSDLHVRPHRHANKLRSESASARTNAAFTAEGLNRTLPTLVIHELVTIYFRKKSEGGLWFEGSSLILLIVAPPR
jgi:hypothetical protein